MAIVNVTDIEYRKFSGFVDTRYPTGYWEGQGTVTGDASGGDMTAQIDFSKAAGLRDSQYYSLEEFMAFPSTAGGGVMSILVTNFGLGTRRYSATLVAGQGGVSAFTWGDIAGIYGLFLGQQRVVNTATGLSFTLDNVDGTVVTVLIGGYVWSARSTSVAGGPQRPPTGLYRA